MQEDDSQHFVGKVSQKVIITYNDQVLVCKGLGDSLWEFPGGRLHTEETPYENLVREVREELSLEVQHLIPLYVGKSLHVKTNTWRVLITYKAITDNPSFVLDPDELEEAKWVSFEELKTISMFEDCREAANVFLNEKEG